MSAIFDLIASSLSAHSRLRTPTTKFGTVQLIFIANLLILKYILSAIGLVRKPTVVKDGLLLPELSIIQELIITDAELDNMSAALASASSTAATITTTAESMLLPALTTPLVLLLFSKITCPVYPFGAVNTTNRFEYMNSCDSVKDNLKGKPLHVIARLGGADSLARRVKRGMEIDIVIEVSTARDDAPIFRQTVTILQFMSASAPPSPSSSSASSAATTIVSSAESTTATIKDTKTSKLNLAPRDPWLWAAVCKDYNPIHVSSILAKSFGFQTQIAHGNHVVALAQTLVGCNTIAPIVNNKEHSSAKRDSICIVVKFLRPTLVPGQYDVVSSKAGAIIKIYKADKVLVTIERS